MDQIPDRSKLSESQRQIGTAERGEALYRFRLFTEGQKEIAETASSVLAPGVYPPIKDAEKVRRAWFLWTTQRRGIQKNSERHLSRDLFRQ